MINLSMDKELLNIREAAKFLGISIDTLRRWDKSGRLVATRKEGGTHRHYAKEDLDLFMSDLSRLANIWVLSGGDIPSEFYCSNSADFQARLLKMQDLLIDSKKAEKIFSLIVAVTGEIGNNSFDHNLGNWPDIPGIFFGYDIHKGIIVLGDRGLGILKTLSRVRPSLLNHQDALQVAFTETISGRAPEDRGNGLKFVREVVESNPMSLFFQSGDAELRIEGYGARVQSLHIEKSKINIQGCLAIIKF